MVHRLALDALAFLARRRPIEKPRAALQDCGIVIIRSPAARSGDGPGRRTSPPRSAENPAAAVTSQPPRSAVPARLLRSAPECWPDEWGAPAISAAAKFPPPASGSWDRWTSHTRTNFSAFPGLGVAHHHGNHVKLRRKGSAEPAAFLAVRHLHQFDPAHVPQQFARLLLQAQFAQRVASIMVGDAVRKRSAHVAHAPASPGTRKIIIAPSGAPPPSSCPARPASSSG